MELMLMGGPTVRSGVEDAELDVETKGVRQCVVETILNQPNMPLPTGTDATKVFVGPDTSFLEF
jgi:hypothetical protein